MKKILALSLAGALAFATPAPSLASSAMLKINILLDELSFDELLKLRSRVDAALWKSPEWQEVTVPAGVYQIGTDIPAGRWSIRIIGQHAMDTVYYFERTDAGKNRPDYLGSVSHLTLVSESIAEEYPSMPAQLDLDMVDGWYYSCESTTVFTPSAGPSLGFR